MANLDFSVAQHLAAALCSAGHPFQRDVIDATAADLVKWCKGCFIASRAVGPEEQAEALVEKAREWEGGWPDKGGTAKLKALFTEMFPARQEKAWEPAGADELATRGLLAPRCLHCPLDASFCEYGGPRAHKRYLEEQQYIQAHQEEKRPRRAPLIQMTAGEFQARAAAFYRDEEQRKAHQLAEVEREHAERRRDAS